MVEAKGHVEELINKCGAKNAISKKKIYLALEKTSQSFGNLSKPVENWLEPYYQYANRLAVIYFLMNEYLPSVNARLLYIYFYGENRVNLECPQNEQEWLPAIQKMNKRLGIDNSCELSKRIHHLFLPVNPFGSGVRQRSKGK